MLQPHGHGEDRARTALVFDKVAERSVEEGNARLIITSISPIPLAQVLPIFTAALPLKNDFLENGPVLRTLFLLFKTNGAALYPFVARLLHPFVHLLDPKNTSQLAMKFVSVPRDINK